MGRSTAELIHSSSIRARSGLVLTCRKYSVVFKTRTSQPKKQAQLPALASSGMERQYTTAKRETPKRSQMQRLVRRAFGQAGPVPRCRPPLLPSPPLPDLYLSHRIRSGSLLPKLLREPDENSFGAPDVAEPIHVLILDHFADELRAAGAEPGERIVDVLHGEHDA